MKNNKIIYGLFAGLSLINLSFAADTKSNLKVNASIVDTCNMEVSNLVIGRIDPGSKVGESFNAVPISNYYSGIFVTCTKGTLYKVNLGTGSSGTYTERTMLGTKPGNSDKLRYNLYSGYTVDSIRGDGTNGTDNTPSYYYPRGTGNTERIFTTIYIPPGQFVTEDTYVDTIPVTIVY